MLKWTFLHTSAHTVVGYNYNIKWGSMAAFGFSLLPHCLPLLSAETVTTAEAFYLHLKICSTPTLCADAFISVHVSVCAVCVYVCVCIFRVTERVGVGNQERGYISLLHNEPLLRCGDKRKNKKDVSHLWHIYLDRGLTQSHSLPCWDILVRELQDTKWRPPSTTDISMNGIKACAITAVEHCWHFLSALKTHLNLSLNWVWGASSKISHFTFSCLFSALNLNDHFWGWSAAHKW